MEKIKNYISRFFKGKRKNLRYDMRTNEWISLAHNARVDAIETISITFNFGYAKGYRAAMTEMEKKGGAA